MGTDEREEKATIDLLALFLVVLQVTTLSPIARKVKRGGSRFGSPSGGSAWTRRTTLLPQFLRASSAVPGLFKDLFVIFTCLNMYLNGC